MTHPPTFIPKRREPQEALPLASYLETTGTVSRSDNPDVRGRVQEIMLKVIFQVSVDCECVSGSSYFRNLGFVIKILAERDLVSSKSESKLCRDSLIQL